MSQTTIAATLRLPAPQPRGPVSTAVLDALRTGAADAPDSPVHELAARAVAAAVASGDLLRDDDLQLALFILQELHYRGIEGVDDDREWQPGVVGLRRLLERALEQELRDRVPLPRSPRPPHRTWPPRSSRSRLRTRGPASPGMQRGTRRSNSSARCSCSSPSTSSRRRTRTRGPSLA